MKISHEQGVAIHSTPSFVRQVARPTHPSGRGLGGRNSGIAPLAGARSRNDLRIGAEGKKPVGGQRARHKDVKNEGTSGDVYENK